MFDVHIETQTVQMEVCNICNKLVEAGDLGFHIIEQHSVNEVFFLFVANKPTTYLFFRIFWKV